MNYLKKLKSKISLSEVLPELSKVKKTAKEPTPRTAKTVLSSFDSKDSTRGSLISEKPKYDELWKKAWTLAEWIDDSKSDVPWQERAARVPELQAMSLEISRLEQLEAIPPGTKLVINTAKIQDQSFLAGFSPLKIPRSEQASPEACPAKCKRTGKCYGIAYFDGKPGKSEICLPELCRWILQ